MKKIAIKVEQSETTQVYSLAMSISEIEKVCTISRIFRDDDNTLQGYQRSEVKNHIDNIAKYIASENSIIPNSIIIGFSSQVKAFHSDNGTSVLDIPENQSTGVLVDGQQRVAALKLSGKEEFHLPVSVFINDSVDFERQQFLLINSAKPLSRSLIYELLPHASGFFTQELTKRQQPSLIVQLLNYQKDSPLQGLVKLTTNPDGIIADNSLMKMIDNSIREGALYDFRNHQTGLIEVVNRKTVIELLGDYFRSVREVFDDDWGKKPKESRLFHGVGIIALGQLFDEIYYSFKLQKQSFDFFEFSTIKLFRLKPHCRWSSGYWNLGTDLDGEPIVKKWNQIQNLSNDIGLVTRYLIRVYDCIERGVAIDQSK